MLTFEEQSVLDYYKKCFKKNIDVNASGFRMETDINDIEKANNICLSLVNKGELIKPRKQGSPFSMVKGKPSIFFPETYSLAEKNK